MASELSVVDACDLYLRRLARLEVLPEKAIFAAERSLVEAVPEYSGTYRESIEIVEIGDGAWMVHVSVDKMIQQALTHPELFEGGDDGQGGKLDLGLDTEAGRSYVFDIAHPRFDKPDFPAGPYPLRIEQWGALKSDQGRNMWANAASAVADEIKVNMERIAEST